MNPPSVLFSIPRLASAAALLLLARSAQAADYDWTAASGSTWASGWTGGNVPTLADDLTILGPLGSAGALNINVAANANAGSIFITNTDATTLTNTTSGSNKTLAIQGGLTTGTGAVTIGSATSNQNVSISLVSGFGQTWNIGSGGLTLNNTLTRNTGASVNFVAGSGVITTASALALNRGIFYNGDYALSSAGGPVGAVVYGTTANTFNVSGAIGTVASNTAFYNLTGAASISSQNLGGGGTIRFGGNHTLTLSGANTIAGFLTNGATAAVISGGGTLRVNGEMVFATNGGVSDKLTVSSNVTTFNGGVTTTVTKAGLGTLVLSGNNTYNGDTYVGQGTLRTTGATGLGFGGSMTAINVGNSKTTVATGATLDLAPTSAMTVNEAIVLNGGSLVNSGTGTATLDNGIAAVNLTTLGSGISAGATVTFNGGGGTGAAGTVSLGLTNASIDGVSGGAGFQVGDVYNVTGGGGTGATITVTSVSGGAITGATVTNAGSGFTGAPTGIGSKVSGSGSGSGASLSANTTNFALSSFTLSNAGSGYTSAPTVTLTSGTTAGTAILSSLTLNGANTIGGSGNLIVNAAVANGTSAGGLTKIGAGTVTLNGVNTYTGGTTVGAGTLVLGSDLAASSPVTVNGGVLTSSAVNIGLGGVSMSVGEISARGASAAGTFTVAANQSFTATGGTLSFDLLSSSSFDRIVGSGTGVFSLDNTTLALSGLTSVAGTYQLFGGFASGSVSNLTVTGLAEGFTGILDNTGLLTVAASAVPEPSSFAALAGAGILGFAALRRRRVAAC